jgi:hypothetical protein
MRIRSVRVQNYRVHRDLSVAFDPRLTVIGGPNESGKSTLVEAIHRVLFMRHKSTGADLDDMKSNFGGHPEIEIVLEVDGNAVMVRKKFRGQNGHVVLEEQGQQTLSGEKADERLAEVLGERAPARKWARSSWSHLWVWQEQSFADPTEGANRQAADIVNRFQESGAAVVRQSALDARLSAHFAERADTNYSRNGIRKGSPLEAAHERAAAARQAVSERRQALEKLFDANMRLGIARTTLSELRGSLAEREQELSDAQCRSQELAALRSQAGLQEKDANVTSAAYDALVKREHDILALRERVAQLAEGLAPMQQMAEQLEKEAQAAAIERNLAAEQLSASDDAVRTASALAALAKAYLTQLDLRQQQHDLEIRATSARDLEEAISRLCIDLSALPVLDAERCESIGMAEKDLEIAVAGLKVIATHVELLEANVPVTLGGAPLVTGTSERITSATELTMGTGARVRVVPGGGASMDEAQRAVDDGRRTLDSLLYGLGVSTAATARGVLDQRRALENKRMMHEQRLEEYALAEIEAKRRQIIGELIDVEADIKRKGLQGVQLDAPTMIEEARALVDATQLSRDTAEDTQQVALANRAAAIQRMDDALKARQRHAESMAEQQHELDDARTSLNSKIDVYGGDAARAQAFATAKLEYRTAADALSATRGAIALLDPDAVDEDLRMLESLVTNLKGRCDTEVLNERAALQELRQDGSRDPHAELAVAQAQERDAAIHLARVQLQADAIRVLRELYAKEQKQLSEQFAQPLRERVDKYLRVVLPGNGLQLQYDGQKFGDISVARGTMQTVLSFGSLSTGAREQVATALRLGVAEVLAEGYGGTLPIVFDDAFAYSDVDRLKLLQRMLYRASESGLQVIILSCNASDYDGLGTRITLQRPSESLTLTSPPSVSPIQSDDADGDAGDEISAANAQEGVVLPLVSREQEIAFLTALSARGGRSSNQSLRDELGWQPQEYLAVREQLRESGRVTLGRGRGGSVSLVESD